MSSSESTGNAEPRVAAVIEAKRLNEMNRLGDLTRFPVAVLCGATLNVLFTMGVVWHFERGTEVYYLALPYWVVGVLLLNLLPVALLRIFTLRPDTVYPVIEQMNFFRDQHKFSNWVYLAASANMAVWICVVWMASYWEHHHAFVVTPMLLAAVVMLSPAWIRLFRR
jgi:hypothetical protein